MKDAITTPSIGETVITTGITGPTTANSNEETMKTSEPVEEQTPTNNHLPKTTEEMNAIIKERVARAKESAIKDPAIVAALEAQKRLMELARAGMTEPEKLNADLKAAQEQINKMMAENEELKAMQLKQNALSKAKLPLSFADRIHGSTEEEIDTDIAELMTQLKTIAPPMVNITGPINPANGNGASPTIDQMIDEAQKRGDVMRVIKLKKLKASQQTT